MPSAPRAAVALLASAIACHAAGLPPGYVIDRCAVHLHTASAACKHTREVARYLAHAQVPPHTARAWAAADQWLQARFADGAPRDVVLDSGCGTGRSTRALAARHADCLVLGVDRSIVRLAKGARHAACDDESPFVLEVAPNALLVRADLPAFWRLGLEHGLAVRRHHLLFPNPYPKPAHLQRRWHGHASFPLLLALGGELELRSNWRTYLDEFALAVQAVAAADVGPAETVAATAIAAARQYAQSPPAALRSDSSRSRRDRAVRSYQPTPPFLTDFEEKYALAGVPLYALELSA